MEVMRYRSFADLCHDLRRHVPGVDAWKKGLMRDLWDEYNQGARHFVKRKKRLESIVHATAVEVLWGDARLCKKYETRDGLVILPDRHDDERVYERAAHPLEDPSFAGARAVERVLGIPDCAVLFSSKLVDGRPAGYERKHELRSREYPGLIEISHVAERTLMLGADIRVPSDLTVEERGAEVRYEWEPHAPAASDKRQKKRA